MIRARLRIREIIFFGLVALRIGVLPAVDIQVQGVAITLSDPIEPFFAAKASPLVISPGASSRLIIPSAVEGEMSAIIDVAPMPPNLSLADFWPEYLQGIREEVGEAAIEEAVWKRGILQGRTASASTNDQNGESFFTKVYMVSSKGSDAFFAVEVRIAKGQDAKEIERQIDLALTKAKRIEEGAP